MKNTRYPPFARIYWTLMIGLLPLSPWTWGEEAHESEEVRGAEEETVHELEAFPVVGTRIRGIDLEKTVPGLQLNTKTLQETGFSRIDETLRSLPIMAGYSDGPVYDASESAPGLSTVSMRGIYSGHLVLINGLRIPPYGGSSLWLRPYDLATISSGSIEEVEILSDGASAIYGADAVSGVLNYRTVRVFRGTRIGLGAGFAEGTDSGEVSVDLLHGQAIGAHGNLVVAINHYKRNNLGDAEYAWSADTDMRDRGGFNWSSAWFFPAAALAWDETLPDYHQQWVSFASPTSNPSIDDFQIVPDRSQLNDMGGGYNYKEFTDYMGDQQQNGLYLHYDDKLNEAIRIYLDLFYSRSWARHRLAPTPYNTAWLGFSETSFPAVNPFNPLGVSRTDGGTPEFIWPLRGRIMEAGPRIIETTTDVPRIVAGLDGEVWKDWTWSVSGVWSESRTKTVGRNTHNWGRFLEVLGGVDLDGNGAVTREEYFNPFGYNSGEILDYISVEPRNEGTYELRMVDAYMDGELLNRDDLVLKAAFGGEYYDSDFAYNPDPLNQAGLIIGGDGKVRPSGGTRSVVAAYTELHMEYKKQFTSQIAGRFEQYSDFGNVRTPKIAASWRVIPEVMLRGSYGEGFTAPTLPMLNQPQTSSYVEGGIIDPKRDEPVGWVWVHRGGNPNLDPETSINRSAGIVLEPFARVGKDRESLGWLQPLTIGANYVDIDYTNLVDEPDFFFLMEFEEELDELYPNQDVYVIRDPPAEGETYGPITELAMHYANLSYLRSKSYDFWIELPVDLKDLGKVTFRCDATRMQTLDYSGQNLANTVFALEWRGTARINWEIGSWTTAWYVQYYDDLDDPYDNLPPVDSAIRINAQVSYAGLWDTRITLGARNLMNEDPPFYTGNDRGAHWLHPTEKRFWYLRIERTF